MVVEKIGDEENFTQKEALTPADDGQQTRSRVWRVRKQTRVNSRGSVGYAILSRLFFFLICSLSLSFIISIFYLWIT